MSHSSSDSDPTAARTPDIDASDCTEGDPISHDGSFAPESRTEILRPQPSDVPRVVKPDALVRELNHRIKNILGVVRALMTVSRRAIPGSDALAEEFLGRLDALARAQDQSLGRASAPDLSLHDLVAEELAPFTGRYGPVSRIEGPEVGLSRRGRMVVSLVLHELATNAVKYGALSSADGMVEVLWTFADDGNLNLWWSESGGPRVDSTIDRGFGTGLLSETVPLELGGAADIEISALGLSAKFEIPSKHLLAPGERRREAPPAPQLEAVTLLAGHHVLLAEDNVVIAYDLEDMVLGLGARRVTVATRLDEALSAIARGSIDFAILDLDLGGKSALPAAEALHEQNVPFIFASGQTQGVPKVAGAPTPLLMQKPYSTAALTLAVSTALMGRL